MTSADLDQVTDHRFPDAVATRGSAVWAAGQAARLLSLVPKKWAHTQEVARHARWASAGVPGSERELLVAASFLHDIGYATPIAVTGFHPLDGARFLRRIGLFELACLVGHHSGAAVEAEYRGLSDELAEFPQPTGAVADALTYSDVTSGPTGRVLSRGDRVQEISRRRGAHSVITGSTAEARAQMYAAVARTLRRATAVRPPITPLTITPVELGCSTLVRFQGVLDESTAGHAVHVLRRVLAERPHNAVCDLALLTGLTAAGAGIFAAVAATVGADTAITLLDPPAGHRTLIQACCGDTDRLSVVAGIEAALVPHCA